MPKQTAAGLPALDCSQPVMSDTKTASQTPSKTVKPSIVKVAKSLIHDAGRGVFATAAIDEGKEVCYYHGEVKEASTKLTAAEVAYTLSGTQAHERTVICGYREIQPDHPYGVAQLINDGTRVDVTGFPETGTVTQHIRWLAERCDCYMKASHAAENVTNSDDAALASFRATRPIKAGEELYFSYGPEYWLHEAVRMPTASLAFCRAALRWIDTSRQAKALIINAVALSMFKHLTTERREALRSSVKFMRSLERAILSMLISDTELMLSLTKPATDADVLLVRKAVLAD